MTKYEVKGILNSLFSGNIWWTDLSFLTPQKSLGLERSIASIVSIYCVSSSFFSCLKGELTYSYGIRAESDVFLSSKQAAWLFSISSIHLQTQSQSPMTVHSSKGLSKVGIPFLLKNSYLSVST